MNTLNERTDARLKSLTDLLLDSDFWYPGKPEAHQARIKPGRIILLLGSDPKTTINPTTSWRPEARDILRRHGFSGTIMSGELHGRNPKNDPRAWRAKNLPHANRFVVWFDEHSECHMEESLFRLGKLLGEQHTRSEVFIGWNDQQQLLWLQEYLVQAKIHIFSSLSTLCQKAAVGIRKLGN